MMADNRMSPMANIAVVTPGFGINNITTPNIVNAIPYAIINSAEYLFATFQVSVFFIDENVR